MSVNALGTQSGAVNAPICVLVLYVGAGAETLQCLGSCISVSLTVRDASTAGASLLRDHLTAQADVKTSGSWAAGRSLHATCAHRRRSGGLLSRTESQWLELLMENGDRQRILQRRLLGIYPDNLDFQRILAWSSGSHVPPAVHVSRGYACPLWCEDTPISRLRLLLLRNLLQYWRLNRYKSSQVSSTLWQRIHIKNECWCLHIKLDFKSEQLLCRCMMSISIFWTLKAYKCLASNCIYTLFVSFYVWATEMSLWHQGWSRILLFQWWRCYKHDVCSAHLCIWLNKQNGGANQTKFISWGMSPSLTL